MQYPRWHAAQQRCFVFPLGSRSTLSRGLDNCIGLAFRFLGQFKHFLWHAMFFFLSESDKLDEISFGVSFC